MIKIKYLASLSEKLGKTDETLTTDSEHTVAHIWAQLNPDTPLPANTICAINFDYATLDSVVPNGSELAFFPPVTGG